jgi:4-hydroxy-tetrahydrodipicolinate synthase
MSYNIEKVCGIVVPIITPLNKDESIDRPSLKRMVNHLIEAGVHGIFANSTTGEGLCLQDTDKKLVLQTIVEQVNHKVPVYAGVSDTSTKRALNNIKAAEDLGADFIVAHPPFYFPPNSQEELYMYFEQIIYASSKPVMLYNIPLTTQAPIALETIKRLLGFEKVIGIKDSSVDYVFLQNLIELKNTRRDFKIFIGKTHMWAAGILSGADGGLDGISNVIPEKCVELYRRIKDGLKDVFILQREINEIFRIYECRSFLGGIKAALSLMGFCNPYTTHPILMASDDEVKRIKNILTEWGVLKQK